MPNQIVLRASSISTYKACPRKFQFAYDLGVVPYSEGESLRVGTNWHLIMEQFAQHKAPEPVYEYISNMYAAASRDSTYDWETERQILLSSFAAYAWYYASQPQLDVIATELSFALPIQSPAGKNIPVAVAIATGTIRIPCAA